MGLFLVMKYCSPPPGSIRDPYDVHLELFRQAQTDVAAGNYKAAIPLLDQAIQIYPNDVTSIIQRANAYREMGQSDRALQDYNQAIVINPVYLEAYFHRGIMFLKSNAYSKAIADFNFCIERDRTGL